MKDAPRGASSATANHARRGFDVFDATEHVARRFVPWLALLRPSVMRDAAADMMSATLIERAWANAADLRGGRSTPRESA
jgi:hypothetical protein